MRVDGEDVEFISYYNAPLSVVERDELGVGLRRTSYLMSRFDTSTGAQRRRCRWRGVSEVSRWAK